MVIINLQQDFIDTVECRRDVFKAYLAEISTMIKSIPLTEFRADEMVHCEACGKNCYSEHQLIKHLISHVDLKLMAKYSALSDYE